VLGADYQDYYIIKRKLLKAAFSCTKLTCSLVGCHHLHRGCCPFGGILLVHAEEVSFGTQQSDPGSLTCQDSPR
jgi:hypothetical protein